MTDLYEDIDAKQTQKNAKIFLKEYRKWKLQSMRFHNWMIAEYGETPKDTSEATKADYECALRTKTLEQLAQIDDRCHFLSDLLVFRYVNNWMVVKVCSELADKYNLDYIAERTYTNHLNEALWNFAVICPRDLMMKK